MRARGASSRTRRAALPAPSPSTSTARRRAGGSQQSGAARASHTEPVQARPGTYQEAKVPSTRSARPFLRSRTSTRASPLRRPARAAYNPVMTEPLFAAPRGAVVRVALPLPVDQLFDYAAPASLAAEARPGCRVLVPFRERHLTGVVVETADAPASRLRPIERVLDPEPALSASMLRILREAAAEFLCPLGLALAAALPPGAAPRVRTGFALTPRGRAALESGAVRGPARDALAALAQGGVATQTLEARGLDEALLARL